jgi:hypothetical protein
MQPLHFVTIFTAAISAFSVCHTHSFPTGIAIENPEKKRRSLRSSDPTRAHIVYRESAQQIGERSRCGPTLHGQCHWIAGDFPATFERGTELAQGHPCSLM